MTERCQAKFKEKNTNILYFYYISITVVLLAVLYCYRFLFIVLSLSYGLGCAACCFILEPSILQRFIEKINWKDATGAAETVIPAVPRKGCATCSLKDCQRHDEAAAAEPWVGLRIHKQLDQAIEDFYNAVLEQFVNSWYGALTQQPFFLDELRHQLRYASACLLRRALKINYVTLITDRLIPCALHHFAQHAVGPAPPAPRAAANRAAELRYLRSVTEAVAPALLPGKELGNEVFHILVRELFAGWALLPLADVLADPHALNTLLVLATGEETMAQLPAAPDYTVEFLETFARQSESVYTKRSKLLGLCLERALDDQHTFYAFMQFLKTTSHIHLLQFYKDIKSFQTKLLNPVLCEQEQQSILDEAQDIFTTYFDANSANSINMDQSLVDEMRTLLTCNRGEDSIKRLQTSKALYQAARQSHAALEKVMLPRFLHSEEFYKIYLGSRIPTGYHKQMTKKPDKLAQTALRVNSKLAAQPEPSSSECAVELLQYLDCLLDERPRDLAGCRAALQDVAVVQQAPPRRGPVRVFTLAVHLPPRAPRGPGPPGPPALLAPRRTEHDFHLLHSKLQEFHGHVAPRSLPSRRDNSPLETLRYKYEDYLQQLLQKPILQTSELLHLFLTVEGDFSQAVQASSLGGNGTDLTNIYQTVAHRLKKEKGQHLEGFLKNFLLSADMERYQALKLNTAPIDEAAEASDDASVERFTQFPKESNSRVITNGVFGDNFGVEPVVLMKGERQEILKGFVQCAMYLLQKIINARWILTAVIGTLLSISKEAIDKTFNRTLDHQLRTLLSERRLAHLIRLGHSLLFGKRASEPRSDPTKQRILARKQLLESIPPGVAMATGGGLAEAASRAFDLIQNPQLNKQLVYELLDLCLAELFPELSLPGEESNKPR